MVREKGPRYAIVVYHVSFLPRPFRQPSKSRLDMRLKINVSIQDHLPPGDCFFGGEVGGIQPESIKVNFFLLF